MAHYAFLDENNIVTEVIVGKDESDTSTLPDEFNNWEEYYSSVKDNATCKRTSYNTLFNNHVNGGVAFRGNYAGIGFLYDTENDVFLPPKPFESWLINTNTWDWEAPVEKPTLTQEQIDNYEYYEWNEDTLSWDLINE